MFKTLLQTVQLMMLVLLPFISSASHIAGADISATYIGTGPNDRTYRVDLTVYKSCDVNSAQLAPTEIVFISSPSLSLSVPLTVTTVSGPDTISAICQNNKSSSICHSPGGIYPGYIKVVYSGNVTLSAAAPDWIFRWTNGSRNANISNLCNTATQNITVAAGINNLNQYWKSTPRFTYTPASFYLINNPTLITNNPLDLDADSLVIVNAAPLGCMVSAPGCLCGPNTEISFQPPYSLNNPLPTTTGNPYLVDSGSGTASFTPNMQGRFNIAFRCEKYDRTTKTLIGFCQRDYHAFFINGTGSQPPVFDSLTTAVQGGTYQKHNKVHYIYTHPGDSLRFKINATFANTTDIGIRMLNAPINANLTVTSPQSTVRGATFNWVPTVSDIGEHIMSLEATDSSCTSNQVNKYAYASYVIKVLPAVQMCSNSTVTLKANGNPANMQWQLNGADISGATGNSYTVNAIGAYRVRYNTGNLTQAAVVSSIPAPTAPLTTNSINNIISTTGGYASYQWYLNGTAISGATSFSYQYTTTGNYNVTVTATNGCTATSATYQAQTLSVETISNPKIAISPNPTTGIIRIDGVVPAKVKVFNAVGQTILEKDQANTISIAHMPNGVYLIQVYNGAGIVLGRERIIKQ